MCVCACIKPHHVHTDEKLVVKVDGPEKAEATVKEEKNGWIGG